MGTKERLMEQVIKGAAIVLLAGFLGYTVKQSIVVMAAASTIEETKCLAKKAKEQSDSSLFYSKMMYERFVTFEAISNTKLQKIDDNLFQLATKLK